MAENKTKPTKATLASYLAGIKDEARRQDCAVLAKLMTKATGEPATMWGPGIVGFGSYHYEYDSGREGDSCVAGFSSRKSDITLYLSKFSGREKLLAKLGKHTQGGSCLYIRRLGDVDLTILEQLVAAAAAERKRLHS